MKINAQGIYYRDLNRTIRDAVAGGAGTIELDNVNGQYFIGDGINKPVTITINGVPGNDLGAFMNGATIIVKENGQDNIGNTMNAGKIIVHGHAGDVLGYGMRGGRIHILKDVGYRIGIHMKSYDTNKPVLIAGGKAGDFFGEYMAGGVLVLLGMFDLDDSDREELESYLKDYCADFSLDFAEVMAEKFVKIIPKSKRPYGNMYCTMPR
jgi:glutamate synthase domain-containing protein 3